ncbi:amidase family protein, partial [Mycobacterium tuberculosis]|uniref:amidase family protein n=1 Tax=Mycobacterium tuberculosis TaxID=1773 RepID=UPI0004F2A36A
NSRLPTTLNARDQPPAEVSDQRVSGLTGAVHIAGTPATTMPITTTATGLPIGIQAMGPAGGDRTTVEFAALLTEVLGGFRVPPL